MKILIVNKFLYPNGGSETYIFELGKQLQKLGHSVEYFGMEHQGRIVGNTAQAYTRDMDFHTGKLAKLMYPFKIIYSFDARKQIRKVLEVKRPDVVHLNNINFQITPSIIDEVIKFSKQTKKKIKIVFTAHDYQWVCPNHMMRIPSKDENCDRCVSKSKFYCTKNRCIHDSLVKSLLGSVEANLYKHRKTYGLVDTIICPSKFLYEIFSRDKVFGQQHKNNVESDVHKELEADEDRLVVKHNFFIRSEDYEHCIKLPKKEYVLYFGRFSKEKGLYTLIAAMKRLPEIPFVLAGSGPLEHELHGLTNVTNVGFLSGEELHTLIRQARFSIYPSEWYENCPFSVMESISYGTPVIGAHIGGIPELIREDETGITYASGDLDELTDAIYRLWNDTKKQEEMEQNCLNIRFDTVETYVDWLFTNVY